MAKPKGKGPGRKRGILGKDDLWRYEFPDADFHLKWLQKRFKGPWVGRRRDT